ncbi:O-antigen ligase family protein [Asticcacaulis sp.]|uniref:O-antigen ligase family protein n=1 Tax=Asticcacaulis sp. TaxID=1872648 RepID=UPI0031CE3FF9
MAPADTSKFQLPSYTGVIMGITLVFLAFFTYAGPLGYALTATFGGLLLLGYWRQVRWFGWVGLTLGLLLIWLVSRSTLLYDLHSGADFSRYKTWEDQEWLKIMLEPLWYGALILAAWAMKPRTASGLMTGLLYAYIGLCALIIVDALSGARLYQVLSAALYKPIRPDLAMVKVSLATYAFVLLYWPLMLAGRDKPTFFKAVALAACVLAPLVTDANAPTLALIVSFAVYWLVRRFPVVGGLSIYKIMATLVGFKILFTPLIIDTIRRLGLGDDVRRILPASWDARLDIWEFAAQKILQKPFLGWGFDSSRHFGKPIPLHPHNMSIQVGLELGYIGLFLLAAVWVLLILRIGRGAPELREDGFTELRDLTEAGEAMQTDPRPYALAALSAVFVIAQLSFGIWQEWWLALMALVTAIYLMARSASQKD